MSWFRLDTGFLRNKKIARMRAQYGGDYILGLLSLWSYAGEHQKDGDFSGYSDAELMGHLASSNAQAMLQAFRELGFIEKNGHLHDWLAHNGQILAFTNRARKAANARWQDDDVTIPPPSGIQNKQTKASICLSNAPSIAPPSGGKRKQKPKNPPHPEFKRAIAAWCYFWKKDFKTPCSITPADGAAMKRLLVEGWTVETLIPVFRAGWGSMDKFIRSKSTSICGFQCVKEQIRAEMDRKPNQGNLGPTRYMRPEDDPNYFPKMPRDGDK